jgi:hypothetical protein
VFSAWPLATKLVRFKDIPNFLWFVPAVKYLPRYIRARTKLRFPLYSGTKPRPILLFSSEIANLPQFQDLKPVSLKVNCTFGLEQIS